MFEDIRFIDFSWINNPSQEEKAIIEDYWKYENGEFVYKLKEICKKHSVKNHRILKLSEWKTNIYLLEGICNCGEPANTEIITRTNLRRALSLLEDIKTGMHNAVCSSCLHKSFLFGEDRSMNDGKIWAEAHSDVYEYWKKLIAELDDKDYSLLRTVYNEGNLINFKANVLDKTDSYVSKQIWKRLYNLEKSGFFELIKKENSNWVVDFNFDIMVNDVLVYIDRPAQDFLTFFSGTKPPMLIHLKAQDNSNWPISSEPFVLQENIHLEKGATYQATISKTLDGGFILELKEQTAAREEVPNTEQIDKKTYYERQGYNGEGFDFDEDAPF